MGPRGVRLKWKWRGGSANGRIGLGVWFLVIVMYGQGKVDLGLFNGGDDDGMKQNQQNLNERRRGKENDT